MTSDQVTPTLDDLDRFATSIERGDWDLAAGARVTLARAPGRLDVMGGIADYSGSLVLEMPIAEATMVGVQSAASGLSVVTRVDGAERRAAVADWWELIDGDLGRARAILDEEPTWLAYVAGSLRVLLGGRPAERPSGLRVVVSSAVPEGKGVSSSAALEVATLRAAAVHLDIALDPRELAMLAQRAENEVVGAPCGVMDPMTSVLGQAGALLALRCQPAEVEGTIAVPPGLSFVGLDSGVRHAVSGFDYGAVRTAAFMGYRLLVKAAGADRWNGYLANVTSDELDRLGAVLPESMGGARFLEMHGEVHDTVTRVSPDAEYPVRAATRHPIEEHARVRRFASLLADPRRAARVEMGELMVASHRSYSACGLGSEATDLLVELALELGADRGVYGAKITGGGSGGTVAVAVDRSAASAVTEIRDRYRARTGHDPYLFGSSSPGAASVPTRSITPVRGPSPRSP